MILVWRIRTTVFLVTAYILELIISPVQCNCHWTFSALWLGERKKEMLDKNKPSGPNIAEILGFG